MMTDASSNGSFVSMCCNPDILYPPISSCYRNGSVASEKITFPQIYDSNFSISTMSPSSFIRSYEFSCDGSTYDLESFSPKNDRFHLMENGSIYVNESTDGAEDYWLGTEDYCLYSRTTENGTRIVVSVCMPYIDNGLTFDDLLPEKILYPISISLSLVFLAATFLVYTILPELKNVHGLILRAYIACLFVFYTLVLIIDSHPEFICTHSIGNL